MEKRNGIEQQMDEISELNSIINNFKEIKLEDFDRRKYDHLINIRTKYERFLDSMIYFIDQNIKTYRAELMIKIKKYDEMLNKIHDELNEEQINNYSEDTLGPLLFLEDKSLLISKANENEKMNNKIDDYKNYKVKIEKLTKDYDILKGKYDEINSKIKENNNEEKYKNDKEKKIKYMVKKILHQK